MLQEKQNDTSGDLESENGWKLECHQSHPAPGLFLSTGSSVQMNEYLVELLGLIDVEELSAMSPVHMTPTAANQDCTTFTIYTDQSGMLGLLRHLHNLGIVIVSCGNWGASRKETPKEDL